MGPILHIPLRAARVVLAPARGAASLAITLTSRAAEMLRGGEARAPEEPARRPERAPEPVRPRPDPAGTRPEPAAEAQPEPAAAPPKPAATREPASPPQAAPPSPLEEPAHVSEEPVLVSESADPGAEDGAGPEISVLEPWKGYRRMKAGEVIDRLTASTPAELTVVRLYEGSNRRRKSVLEAVDRQLG